MSDNEDLIGKNSGFNKYGGVFDEQKEREMEVDNDQDNKYNDELDPIGKNDEDHLNIVGIGDKIANSSGVLEVYI